MRILRVRRGLLTEAIPVSLDGGVLNLEEQPFAEGGFGKLYRGSSPLIADGTILAVKIFTRDGAELRALLANVQALQGALNSQFQRTGRSAFEIGALYCLPLLTFEGEFKGRAAVGYAARYLSPDNVIDFGAYLDQKPNADYGKCTLSKRLALMLDLVESMGFLEDLDYIHADINAANLMIDIVAGRLYLIDFDAGVVAQREDDHPLTWGKQDDWTAPEIRAQLTGASTKRVAVDVLSDRWAVSVGLFYLLTTSGPYSFLKSLSDHAVRTYFSRYQWPDIRFDDQFAQPANRGTWETLHQYFHSKTGFSALLPLFQQVFDAGYTDRPARPSYPRWRTTLRALLQKSEKELMSPPDPITAKQRINRPRPAPPPRQHKPVDVELPVMKASARGRVYAPPAQPLPPAIHQWLVRIGGMSLWKKLGQVQWRGYAMTASAVASRAVLVLLGGVVLVTEALLAILRRTARLILVVWRGIDFFWQASVQVKVMLGVAALAIAAAGMAGARWVADVLGLRTPQPTAILNPRVMTVSTPALNFRAAPGAEAPFVAILYVNTLLELTGQSRQDKGANWVEARLTSTMQRACVADTAILRFERQALIATRQPLRTLYGQTCSELNFSPVGDINGWVNAQYLRNRP